MHCIVRICRSDLICVDDIDMLPARQDATEAFCRIVDAACERRSVSGSYSPSSGLVTGPDVWEPSGPSSQLAPTNLTRTKTTCSHCWLTIPTAYQCA